MDGRISIAQSHGIRIGTRRLDVEKMLEGSSDYYLPNYSVLCLGARELHLGFGRADTLERISFPGFENDLHYICPEHIFEAGHAGLSAE